MAEPWGEILYRAAATIAGLVALPAILNFFYTVNEGEPIVPVAALSFAAIIWLIGLCCSGLFDDSEGGRHPARTLVGSVLLCSSKVIRSCAA
jgi:hypothetical protein